MATITVRNLDDAVYERLKREAKANHRSLEAEARLRLTGQQPAPSNGLSLAEDFRRVMVSRRRADRLGTRFLTRFGR